MSRPVNALVIDETLDMKIGIGGSDMIVEAQLAQCFERRLGSID